MKKYLPYVLGVFLVITGITHFTHRFVFLKMMPRPFLYPLQMVYLSGVIEIILGIAVCFTATRRIAAWGIIALLLAIFPANIFMAQHSEDWNITPLLLYLRLPLQFFLIYWAFQYTKKSN
jgi:hypothetical protein